MAQLLRHVLAQRRRNGAVTPIAQRRPVPRQPRALEHEYLAAQLVILRKVKAIVQARLVPELGRLVSEARRYRTDAAFVRIDEAYKHLREGRATQAVVRPAGGHGHVAIEIVDPEAADVRRDGYIDILASLIDSIEAAAKEATGRDRDILGLALDLAHKTDSFNRGETTRTIKELTGLEVVAGVPGLEDKLGAFARQNAQLIKSVPADYLHDIEQTTLRYLREGRRAEELAGELEDRFGVAQNRAALIAVDQIGKLNSELTTERHTSLGITRYYWRNVGDERVRPDHVAKDGRIFEYSKPPLGGHPGMPVRCRCYQDPVVEDLLG